jgi:CheY-like chemotaxis protein
MPRRILVIEDNEDAREILRMQLRLEGHEVHEAADGPSGVAATAAVAPDVVLIDVGLPVSTDTRSRAGSAPRPRAGISSSSR